VLVSLHFALWEGFWLFEVGMIAAGVQSTADFNCCMIMFQEDQLLYLISALEGHGVPT
jgi:hypothetical protein